MHRLDQVPDHPVQLVLGGFDVPADDGGLVAGDRERRVGGPVPEVVVRRVRGEPLG